MTRSIFRHAPTPLLAIAGLSAILAACSSGGSGSDSHSNTDTENPDKNSVAISGTTLAVGNEPKMIDVSWQVDKGEDKIESYRLEVNPDGASGFTTVQGADAIEDTSYSFSVPVHLADLVNASYRVVAVDGEGNELAADDAVALLGNVTGEDLTGYFAAGISEGDRTGNAIAVSGDGRTIAVATTNEGGDGEGVNPSENENFSQAGAVYVFHRGDDGHWGDPDYIKSTHNDNGDKFGSGGLALNADGNTLAVGATWTDGSGTGVDPAHDNDAVDAGAVHVYTRDDAGTWAHQSYIKATNAEAGDEFGNNPALSASGDTLAVSATEEAGSGEGVDATFDNNAPGAGAVYVYSRDGAGAWSPQSYIKATNTEDGDTFGSAIALSDDGDTLAVGARNEDGGGEGVDPAIGNTLSNAGSAYVYTRDDVGTWSPQSYIKPTNGDVNDRFGTAIALDATGDTLAVTALSEDGDGTGVDPATNNNTSLAGATYLYTRDDTDNWSMQHYIKATNTGSSDRFGISVALDAAGQILVVGARSEDGSGTGIDPADDNASYAAGAAYVYVLGSSDTWKPHRYIKAPNTDADDYFGKAVALDASGETLAITAPLEDGSGTGINPPDDNNGNNNGAFYLY